MSAGRKTALFINAEKLRMSKRFAEAIPAYEAVLREDPDDMQVRKTLAGLYLMQGDPKQSLIGYMLLATCLIVAGKLDDAAAILTRIRNLDAKRRLSTRIAALETQIAVARERGVATGSLGISSDQLVIEVQEAVEVQEIVEEAGAPEVAGEAAPAAGVAAEAVAAPEATSDEEPEPEIVLEPAADAAEIVVDASEEPDRPAAPAAPEPTDDIIVEDEDAEEVRLEPLDADGQDVEQELLEGLRGQAEREAADVSRSYARLSTTLFEHIPPDALADLIDACQSVEFQTGAAMFLEGSESDSVLLLAEGSVVERARRTEDLATVTVGSHGPGELLGLMAFLANDAHDTAFVAETPCHCYRLDYEDVERLMGEHVDLGIAMLDAYKDHVIATFMKTSATLSALPAKAQRDLVRAFELARAHVDEAIIREGTKGDDLYFVKKGSVVVTVTRDGQTVELGRMGKHAFFGEMSFITGAPRSASVVATTPTELLRVAGEKMQYVADENPEVRDVLAVGQEQHLAERQKRLK